MTELFSALFVFSFLIAGCNGQKEIELKIEKTFLDKTDTTKNCYTTIYPPTRPWKGHLFLVPGFGETAEKVFQQTDLPLVLAQRGILTVIPTFQDGVLSFGADSLSQNTFDRIVKKVVSEHELTGQRFFVGGFSIGGSCAVKYAQNAAIVPTAVFAIDPPLDFERYYNSAKRDVRLSKEHKARPENRYMLDRIEEITGGSPLTHAEAYYKLSPYSLSDSTQSAVKKLAEIPLRIYSEPDIDWWMNERRADLTQMNITDITAMVQELRRLGNQNAELITTQNKGYRKPGHNRHPHSWSIANTSELAEWLLDKN